MKTFAWRFWYPRVALMRLRPRVFILCYFMFMKLRPQVFILCKNVTIEFSWISVSCFQPVQECHHLVFISVKSVTTYFSWISVSCFHPVHALHRLLFMNLRPVVSATVNNFYLHFLLFLNTFPWFHVSKLSNSCAETGSHTSKENQKCDPGAYARFARCPKTIKFMLIWSQLTHAQSFLSWAHGDPWPCVLAMSFMFFHVFPKLPHAEDETKGI